MKKEFLLCLCLFLCATNICAQDFSTEEIEVIKQRVIEKYYDFISYLPEIAGKSGRPVDEKKLAQKYIDVALDLFINKGESYQYRDEWGELRTHEGARVKIYTKSDDNIGLPSHPVSPRKFLQRLMFLEYYKMFPPLIGKISIKKRPNMPENALYSIVDENGTVIAFIVGHQLTGDDNNYIIKLFDINLIQK